MHGPDVEADREIVDRFARYCVKAGQGSLLRWLRRPRFALQALRAARRLPELDAVIPAAGEGPVVRRQIQRSVRTFTPVDRLNSVLVLPASIGEYLAAPARATVRRKLRAAERAGTTCAFVADHDERRVLLAIADERERTHPDAKYRYDDPRNQDLFDVGLWLVARDASGAPIALAVIPAGGEWATLRYFRTLVQSEQASLARWQLTVALVEALIDRDVRYLVDTISPFRLTNGLRHFQLMLGFALCNVRVRPDRRAARR